MSQISQFYFCEACGKRVTDVDLMKGDAKDKQLKGIFCKHCSAGVTTVEFYGAGFEKAIEEARGAYAALETEAAKPQGSARRSAKLGQSPATIETAPGNKKLMSLLIFGVGSTVFLMAILFVTLFKGEQKPTIKEAKNIEDKPQANVSDAKQKIEQLEEPKATVGKKANSLPPTYSTPSLVKTKEKTPEIKEQPQSASNSKTESEARKQPAETKKSEPKTEPKADQANLQKEAEELKKLLVASSQAKAFEVLKQFEEKLLARDLAGARKICSEARTQFGGELEDGWQYVEKMFEEANSIASSLEKRKQIAMENLQGLKGKHVMLLTQERIQKGTLVKIEGDTIHLEQDSKINGQVTGVHKRQIEWAQLQEKEIENFSQEWKLAGEQLALFQTLDVLARNKDADQAERILKTVQANPLVPWLQHRIQAVRLGEKEMTARGLLTQFELKAKQVQEADAAKKLLDEILAFKKEFNETEYLKNESKKLLETQRTVAMLALKETPLTYLSDMQETFVKLGSGAFHKGVVKEKYKGAQVKHGLWAHPSNKGNSQIKYELAGKFHLLEGVASMLANAKSKVVFSVYGDDRLLWKSKPIHREAVEFGPLDVMGVNTLELRVDCLGSHSFAHAHWVNLAVK